MNILEVEILKIADYKIGKIATVQFPQGALPQLPMIIQSNNLYYKITAFVAFADPFDSVINQNMLKNIFECRVEPVNQPI